MSLIIRGASGRSSMFGGSASDPYGYKAADAAIRAGDYDARDPQTQRTIERVAASQGKTASQYLSEASRSWW